MFDYRKACAYAIEHQQQLLEEAERAHLARKVSRLNGKTSIRPVIWLGDALISVGTRLKAMDSYDPAVDTTNLSRVSDS